MDLTFWHMTLGSITGVLLVFMLDGAWLIIQDRQEAWKMRKKYKPQRKKRGANVNRNL